MRAVLIALVCGGCLPVEAARPASEPPPSTGRRIGVPGERREVPVIEAPVTDPTLAHPPSVLRVLDRDTGAPIEGAEVGRGEALGWTDADGFAAVEARSGAWLVSAPRYVTTEFRHARPQVVYLQPVEPFEMRVTDLAGEPIADARVRCTERHDRWEVARSAWSHTDDNGLVRIADAAPAPGAEFEIGVEGWFARAVPAARVRCDRHGHVIRVDTPPPPAPELEREDASQPGRWAVLLRYGGEEPVPGFRVGARWRGRRGRYRLRSNMDGRVWLGRWDGRGALSAWDPFAPVGLDPEYAEFEEGGEQVLHVRRRPTVRLERAANVPAGATATLAALGRTTPVRWGRRQFVPADVELAVRLVTGQVDLIVPLGTVAFGEEDRTFRVSWPEITPVAFYQPRRAQPVAPAAHGTGRLTVTVRDLGGRFLSGSVALDGGAPKRGATVDFGDVAAGPHRVVVWARRREARVMPVTVVAGEPARVVVPLTRIR